MSSLGSFLQMLKCNRNFVSNRQKFSSHLVEVYHRSCRCIAMSNNISSRVPRVVVWWRCWCLVRYGLLPCHSVNKWREKSSFFDILGEPLMGDNYCVWGTQNIFAFFLLFFLCIPKKKHACICRCSLAVKRLFYYNSFRWVLIETRFSIKKTCAAWHCYYSEWQWWD